MNENPEKTSRPQNTRVDTRGGDEFRPREPANINATIYPIDDLGVIRVSGVDADTFLQGQMTFDIHRISKKSSSLCAFCNPKGRAFATARIVKTDDTFLLIVSHDLVDALIKKLRMYVLRSDVALDNASDDFRLIGVRGSMQFEAASSMTLRLPDAENEAVVEKDLIAVKIGPNDRYLLIAANQTDDRLRSVFEEAGCRVGDLRGWKLLEIMDGIPTVTSNTSEEFVPQMLNLDRLNGISFDKGCYTGQEIVARSHYLGQLKRRIYLAQADTAQPPAAATQLVDCADPQQQSAGKVVNAALDAEGRCYLLAVLKIDSAERGAIQLENCDGDPIRLLELPYSLE